MTVTYDEPVAFGPRAIEMMAGLGVGRGSVILNLCRELSLATSGEAWPRALGKGGGTNLTPVSSWHVVSLLLAILGKSGRQGHGGIAQSYAGLSTLAEPTESRTPLLPVMAEMFALAVKGRGSLLADFAADGLWLRVEYDGVWAGIYESRDAPAGEMGFVGPLSVKFTPYGEPDDDANLAITYSRCVPFKLIHDLALGVREHGMARKPLRLPAAA